MVGNNFRFLEQLYANGAGGFFDAAAVHTDTACLLAPPEHVYRETDGRIGRFAFTGYREVHQVMAAHGDGAKPIWMTELGWNTSSTEPNSCRDGSQAGTKAAGVTEAAQARNLTKAYECMAADPYLTVAMWFSLQDVDDAQTTGHRYGLIDDGGKAKPSLAAFRRFATDPTPPSRSCGSAVDAQAPTVKLLSPREGQQYLDSLVVRANAPTIRA